jgi:hypothetical protein
MADITMCIGGKCPKRFSCYRVLAKASEYQSVFAPEQAKTGASDCAHFWDIQSETKETL